MDNQGARLIQRSEVLTNYDRFTLFQELGSDLQASVSLPKTSVHAGG